MAEYFRPCDVCADQLTATLAGGFTGPEYELKQAWRKTFAEAIGEHIAEELCAAMGAHDTRYGYPIEKKDL